MTSIPALETARLHLRGPTEADAPAIQKYFNDYEVIRQLAAHAPWPYPDDGALVFLREHVSPKQGHDHWVWGLFLKTAPDELIGVIDLWRAERPENRGFWLARPFWGQGLMSEAADKITDHAFNDLGFSRLILSNAVGNLRSRRIKERAGAVLLRTEAAKFVDPAYTEREVWELTNTRWIKASSAF